MKFKSGVIVLAVVICILFGISAVCASDNNTDTISTDDSIQDIASTDNYHKVDASSPNNYSIAKFKEDLTKSNGTFNMEHDYVFGENDSEVSFELDARNYVINGNGHVIESSCNNSGFVFSSISVDNKTEGLIKNKINITINDVTFKNFTQQILGFTSDTLTLNNVKFIDCRSSLLPYISISEDATLVLNNSNIDMASATELMTVNYGKVIINNTNISNKANSSGVSINRGQLIIENSRFLNFKSVNGAVINYKGDYFRLKNSKFINATADFNGGAILAKYFPIGRGEHSDYTLFDFFAIEGCEFLNVSSRNDGGVIFIDLDSGSNHTVKTLSIVGSNFTNCKSSFGGAVAVLGGRLNIENSIFANNHADFEGGALYSSWSDVTVADSTFLTNRAIKNAGAVYFDKGKLTINNSAFLDNRVLKNGSDVANAIYAYDVDAYFANSIFDNGGVAVYADFAGDSKLENITKNEDIFLLDNKNYIVSVESNGIKLDLIKNSIVVSKLPSAFNSSAFGWVSPVRLQGDNDDCWAFATAASLESSLLKSTGKLYNLSENYVQQLQLKYSKVGDKRISLTGFGYSGLGYALSWIGALPNDKPYDARGVIGDTDLTDERIHLQDAIVILGGINNNRDLVKQAILKCGAVSVQNVFAPFDANLTTEGDDISVMEHEIHFISLVGWDDNCPGEDPKMPDGAWICKDSMSGLHTISYYNAWFNNTDYYAIVPQNPVIGYLFENNIDYHVNYQTDLTGLTGFDGNYTYYSNEFTSKYDELIGAVGTYFNESGIDYSFDIYLNNVKVHTQSGVSEFGGFRTIILNKYIPVKAGDRFKVVFKNTNLPYQAYSRVHYMPGMSMISADGKSWKDITLENKTVCLKVYTVRDNSKITSKDLTMKYNDGSYFSVKVVGWDGNKAAAGETVTFIINGKTYTAKTDANGVAKIKITQKAGSYTVTTKYLGSTAKNKLTVKALPVKITLKASKTLKVKKTAKKLILKAALKINAKSVKGKTVTFKFKGKTYKAKTDKKGMAKVTVKRNVIKTLKKGKKYTAKITYSKKSVKTIVTLK